MTISSTVRSLRSPGLLFVILTLGAGCLTNQPMPPLALPKADTGTTISVSSAKLRTTISAPGRVTKIMARIGQLNANWHDTWHTFPTPRYTLEIDSPDGPTAVIWLGDNWIGGRNDGQDYRYNRLRFLTPKQRDQLLRLLDAPAPL